MSNSKSASTDSPVSEFARALGDAYALLAEDWDGTASSTLRDDGDPLPSLLERCRGLVAEAEAQGDEPIRTVHHFACTGGTLISKCLATLPNTVVLSEVNPFSEMQLGAGRPDFAPTDVIKLLRSNRRTPEDDVIVETFLGALDGLWKSLCKRGERLLIRDHPHSSYCTEQFETTRPNVRRLIASRFRVVSAVTVRHPLDSFLALSSNGWVHFEPQTLDEYCRRYLAFLEDHADVPIFRYEDLVMDPDAELAKVAHALEMPFVSNPQIFLDAMPMTGDSGRSGTTIELRDRRPVPDAVSQQVDMSRCYQNLCRKLGYDPS